MPWVEAVEESRSIEQKDRTASWKPYLRLSKCVRPRLVPMEHELNGLKG